MDLLKLQDTFAPDDVEWRIGRSGKNAKGPWATALAYVTNRAIMNRLDLVCGPGNWKNEFREWTIDDQHGVLCGISINLSGDFRNEHWVTKWDGSENTDIESIKGGLSSSMKRAAVQWGIGRYLYDLDETFVDCSAERKPGWKYAKNKEGDFYWKIPALPAWAMPVKTAPQPEPAKAEPAAKAAKAPAPSAVTPVSPAQMAEIEKLARELGMNVQTDILAKMKIATPNAAQADAILKRLRDKLTKELDDAAKKNS